MRELPFSMRRSRKASPLGLSDDAWYYVGPSSIDIFCAETFQPTQGCRLTRKQLEGALLIMDEYRSEIGGKP
jgi:hypothetical protein